MSLVQWSRFWRRKSIPQRSSVQCTRLTCEPLEYRRMLTRLGLTPQLPLMTYVSGGTTTYTAPLVAGDPGLLDIVATPLAFKASAASPPRNITAPKGLQIHIQVDASGNLIGGVPGNDLMVTGNI